MQSFAPQSAEELAAVIAAAGGEGRKLELRGGGSRAQFGAPRDADVIDLRGLAGIVDYDPPELVLTVKVGTPLAEIRALVAEKNQMLAFDPWDDAALYGSRPGNSTIGGIIAAGVGGPLRIGGGAARDHMLGFTAVSGRGEIFHAGAKVVKNVTGFDLSKLVTASWGRLVALTEVTLKVLPQPPVARTVALHGLSDAQAIAAMSVALGGPADVNAAAHLPGGVDCGADGGLAVTLLLLRGVAPSVAARIDYLRLALAEWGAASALGEADANDAWSAVREVRPLTDREVLWRLILPPSRAVEKLAQLAGSGSRHVLDWGGNLAWVSGEAGTAAIRAAAAAAGGHAALVRAPAAMRAAISALHPRPAAMAALEQRVRRAFDPLGLFETGRFGETMDAD